LLAYGNVADTYNKLKIKKEKYSMLPLELESYIEKIEKDKENSVDEIDNEIENFITNGTLKICKNIGVSGPLKLIFDSIDTLGTYYKGITVDDKKFLKGCFYTLRTAYYLEVFKAYNLCYGVPVMSSFSDNIKTTLVYLRSTVLNFDLLINFYRNPITQNIMIDNLQNNINTIVNGPNKNIFSSSTKSAIVIILNTDSKDTVISKYLKNIVLLYNDLYNYIISEMNKTNTLSTTDNQLLTQIKNNLITFHRNWGPNNTQTGFVKEFIISISNYNEMKKSFHTIVDNFTIYFANNIEKYNNDAELTAVFPAVITPTEKISYQKNINKEPTYIKNLIYSLNELKSNYSEVYSLLFSNEQYNNISSTILKSNYTSIGLNTILLSLSANYINLYNNIYNKLTSYDVKLFYKATMSDDIYNEFSSLYTILELLIDITEMNKYYNESCIFASQLLLKECKRLVNEEGNINSSDILTKQFNLYLSKVRVFIKSSPTQYYRNLSNEIETKEKSLATKITDQEFSHYDLYLYKYTMIVGSILNRKTGDTAHPNEHLSQTHLVAVEYYRDIINAIEFFKNKHQFSSSYLTYLPQLNKIKHNHMH
jgi:hypothetical protein